MMFERGLGALLTPWYCEYSPKVGRHGGEQLYNHPIINNTIHRPCAPSAANYSACKGLYNYLKNLVLQYKS